MNKAFNMNRCVVFDRDGVLNELVQRGRHFTSPYEVSELKYTHRAFDAVKNVKDLGFLTFIATNQPNLGLCQIQAINNTIQRNFNLTEIYFAMNQESEDYKPGTGMLKKIIGKYKIDPLKSWMIGDRWKDIVPGHLIGFTTIFVGEHYESPQEYSHIFPNFMVKDVYEASLLIIQKLNK